MLQIQRIHHILHLIAPQFPPRLSLPPQQRQTVHLNQQPTSQQSLSPHIKSVCIAATTSVTDTEDSSHSPSHSSTISTTTITSTTAKTDGSSQPATHQSAVLIATYHECLYCRHNKCYRYKGFITTYCPAALFLINHYAYCRDFRQPTATTKSPLPPPLSLSLPNNGLKKKRFCRNQRPKRHLHSLFPSPPTP